MLTMTARMALSGPVHVLDGGNRFDAYRVARIVRRHTVELDRVLNRIQVARGFTSYQVVTLFGQLPDRATAYLMFDLLATFDDENVSVNESQRLLKIIAGHLERLREAGPAIVISLFPPRRKERAGLARPITDLADHVFLWEDPSVPEPIRLIQE
jgi:hypothetical protein